MIFSEKIRDEISGKWQVDQHGQCSWGSSNVENQSKIFYPTSFKKLFKSNNISYFFFEEKVLEKVSRKKELEVQLKGR